jgi:hypothetical protein
VIPFVGYRGERQRIAGKDRRPDCLIPQWPKTVVGTPGGLARCLDTGLEISASAYQNGPSPLCTVEEAMTDADPDG